MSTPTNVCPRCRTLAADADLTPEPVTYEKVRMALVTDDDDFVHGNMDALDSMDGKLVYYRQQTTKRICKTCQQELGKFGYARRSTSYGGKYKAASTWIRDRERMLANVVCRHRKVTRTVKVGERMICQKCTSYQT